jgi:hypothetical protein
MERQNPEMCSIKGDTAARAGDYSNWKVTSTCVSPFDH